MATARYPLTFITFFFDLIRRDPSRPGRLEKYEKSWLPILRLPYPLVIFCEEDYVQTFADLRGTDFPTTFYPTKFEDLPVFSHNEMIRHCRVVNPIRNGNSKKDTVDYTILILSKSYFIQQTLSKNPYFSSYFALIDIGIHHVATPTNWLPIVDKIVKSEKIRICCMRNTSRKEIENRVEFYSQIRGIVCGGFLTGPKERFDQFVFHHNQEFLTSLLSSVCPSDEQLYSTLIINYPHLFELYYGDYCDILSNFVELTFNPNIVLYNLTRTEAKSSEATHLCQAIEETLKRQPTFFSKEQRDTYQAERTRLL